MSGKLIFCIIIKIGTKNEPHEFQSTDLVRVYFRRSDGHMSTGTLGILILTRAGIRNASWSRTGGGLIKRRSPIFIIIKIGRKSEPHEFLSTDSARVYFGSSR